MIHALNSVLIQYSSSPRLLRWQWHGPVTDQLVMVEFDALLRFARPRQPYYWLSDVSNMAPIGSTAQQWLNETWLPHFSRLRGTKLAIILPTNVHNQLVLENVLANPRYGGSCEIQYFSDTAAALDWLVDGDDTYLNILEEEWQRGAQAVGLPDESNGATF